MQIFQCAAAVIQYLQGYTDFFDILLQQPNCPEKDRILLQQTMGGLLIRHIAQLICNSSVIKKWDTLMEESPVACGIYPSVSMMNHACRTKISM